MKYLLGALVKKCRVKSQVEEFGKFDEVSEMLTSIQYFVESSLFIDAFKYPYTDGTNRHGVAHGLFIDIDYGRPINFYKIISAIDVLTWIGTFKAGGSWMGPDPTIESIALARSYNLTRKLFNQWRKDFESINKGAEGKLGGID